MADFTSRTLNYETLLTVTHDAILDSGMTHDQVFDAHPVLAWLHSGNRLKILDGGFELREGLLYGKNSTAKWYSGHQLLDVTGQEGHTAAIFVWKQGSVSIVYSGKELRQNKGSRTKIKDLVKTKQSQADLSLMDIIATGVFSDGTGSSNNQLTGLGAMLETTPGTTVYASVPTANLQWRNQAAASVGNAAVNLLPNMRTVYNDCSQGKGVASTRPDFVATTQTVYETYEALMTPSLRFSAKGAGDLGFTDEMIKYKNADFVWTDYATSGELYFLNSRHIGLVVHRDANLTLSSGGFKQPANQDSFVAQVLFMGNIVTNNRRKNGKLTGIT
jgi:hypothetical protein